MPEPIDIDVPTDLAWQAGGPDLSRWRVTIRATGCAGWRWEAEDGDGSPAGSGAAGSLAGAEAAALDAILAATTALVFDGEELRDSVRSRRRAAAAESDPGAWRIRVWPVPEPWQGGGQGRGEGEGWAWEAGDDHGRRLSGSAPSRDLAFAAARDATALDWQGVRAGAGTACFDPTGPCRPAC